jgi:hypothetical protein
MVGGKFSGSHVRLALIGVGAGRGAGDEHEGQGGENAGSKHHLASILFHV